MNIPAEREDSFNGYQSKAQTEEFGRKQMLMIFIKTISPDTCDSMNFSLYWMIRHKCPKLPEGILLSMPVLPRKTSQ